MFKNSQKIFLTMFSYTVKYKEFESDIQNNNLLYKIDPTCQNTFEEFGNFRNILFLKQNFLFCNIYKIHDSYFVTFEKM